MRAKLEINWVKMKGKGGNICLFLKQGSYHDEMRCTRCACRAVPHVHVVWYEMCISYGTTCTSRTLIHYVCLCIRLNNMPIGCAMILHGNWHISILAHYSIACHLLVFGYRHFSSKVCINKVGVRLSPRKLC